MSLPITSFFKKAPTDKQQITTDTKQHTQQLSYFQLTPWPILLPLQEI